MYKVGDKVRIKPKNGKDTDYMCTYVKNMTQYVGQIATITQVKIGRFLGRTSRKFYNSSDTSQYSIDLDNGKYVWDCEIFEKYIEADDIEFEEDIDFESSEKFIIQSPDGLLIAGVPVIHEGEQKTIKEVDHDDLNQPYEFDNGDWIEHIEREDSFYIDFLKLLQSHKIIIYQSQIFGRMEISKQNNSDYPLLVKLSDGDLLELTSDFKYFKDSKKSII